MKELTLLETQNISAGTVRPSNWTWSGAAGATVGTAYSAITAFSANPANVHYAMGMGAIISIGFHAAHDILREIGL